MRYKINELIQALNMEAKKIEHIIKNIYLVYTDKVKLATKFNDSAQTRLQLIRRKLLGSISLQNEIKIYKLLGEKVFTNFTIPKLYKTNEKDYLIIEYIEQCDKNINLNNKLPKALVEFQMQELDIKNRLINKIIIKWLRSPNIIIFRGIIRKILPKFGPKIAYKSMKVLICLNMMHKQKLKPMLLHNDICGNYIINQDQFIVFFDFGDSIMEKNGI